MPGLATKTLESDVLVIGGGLAGCFAAIRAREMGASVIVAEKADTRRSGCASTGVDHCWTHIPEIHGPDFSVEDLVRDHTEYAEGFVDQEIATYIASHSFDRLLDLERYGISIRVDDGKFSLIKKVHSQPTFLHFAGMELKPKLTRQVRRGGAKIVNRVMVTDLLTSGGRVAGAIGLDTRTSDIIVFRAGAVVLSTGNIYRLYQSKSGVPFNIAFPPHETGDGQGMAMRAGAELLNMEFTTFQTGPRNFQRCGRGTFVPGKTVDASGRPIDEDAASESEERAEDGIRKTMDRSVESEHTYDRVLKDGRGPVYIDSRGLSEKELAVIRWALPNEGNASLMAYMDERGIDIRTDRLEFEVYEPKGGSGKAGISINDRCETSLEGLYAAGDVIGGVTRAVAPGAFTLGWQAGERAAQFARKLSPDELDRASEELIQGRDELWAGILARRGACAATWKDAQAAMQSTMTYYASRNRSETMLAAGIDRLRRLREDATAELGAGNPHELYRCVEILSLMDSAEMIMVSARARTETRFGPEHSRADYPDSDASWYCNTGLRRDNGQFVTYKKPFNHIYEKETV
ncbi:MAG: FAD-dependent oxidoreductase [Acidobacteriota bacterium]|nr:MAG: FAD-dependent oxidoreductase [Acidobacteriota bacterium]